MTDEINNLRVDKWLWAARFYKTRQLAAKAIKTGKIAIANKVISKPATTLKREDSVSIKRGPYKVHIIIDDLTENRGSATIAKTLYHETSESIAAREALKKTLANQPFMHIDQQKPDKRGVRSQRAFKRGS